MSYCRWSSDDFQCDVYVYADVNGGWTTHVAGRRQTPPEETRPEPVADWWDQGEAGIAAFLKRNKMVREWLATAPLVPIGLPHDDETLSADTPSECADQLEHLRSLGYKVPQGAIDALREEAAESECVTEDHP